VVSLFSLLAPAEGALAQTHSVEAWGGLTEDLKPNPFSGMTARNSASTFGANILFGRESARTWGASASWSRFSPELHHIDLLAVLRLVRSGRIYVDVHGGLSRASWSFPTGQASQDETSIDWLLGPVVGLVLPLGDRIALDLAGVTQFRWSPEYNDYLRLGARVGLAVMSGG